MNVKKGFFFSHICHLISMKLLITIITLLSMNTSLACSIYVDAFEKMSPIDFPYIEEFIPNTLIELSEEGQQEISKILEDYLEQKEISDLILTKKIKALKLAPYFMKEIMAHHKVEFKSKESIIRFLLISSKDCVKNNFFDEPNK